MKTNYLKSKIKNKFLYNSVITFVAILIIGLIIYYLSGLVQVLSKIIFV